MPNMSTPIASYDALGQALNQNPAQTALNSDPIQQLINAAPNTFGNSATPKNTQLANLDAQMGQAQQSIQAGQNRLNSELDKYDQMRTANPRPQVPNTAAMLNNMPEYQEMQKYFNETKQHAQGYLQTASILGGLVGLVNRKHMATAFKAFSAAAEGYKKADDENAERLRDQWKAANDLMINKINATQEDYKNVLNDYKIPLDEQMNKIREIATMNHDIPMLTFAVAKDYASIAANINKTDAATEKAATSATSLMTLTDKMMDAKDKAQGMAQLKAMQDPKFLSSQGVTDQNQAAQLSYIARSAEAIIRGGLDLPGQSSLGGQLTIKDDIREAVLKADPNYTSIKFKADLAAAVSNARNFASGFGAKNVNFINTAKAHINNELAPALEQMSDAGIYSITDLVSKTDNELEDPRLIQLKATATTAADEFVKGITGTAGSIEDREQFYKIFASIGSQGQRDAAVEAANKLLDEKAESNIIQKEGKDMDVMKSNIGKGAYPGSKSSPSQEYIDYLKAHPDSASSFDSHFGEGSSKQYLEQ